MNFPSELQYSKSHEWVRRQGNTAEIGLTDYAQSELGGIVFVNLPQVGDEVTMGEALGDVESVKSVSDVYSPVTGVVSEVNEALLDTPEAINRIPTAPGWFGWSGSARPRSCSPPRSTRSISAPSSKRAAGFLKEEKR